MPLTRDDLRASFERAGEAHWRALVDHHEEAYPRPAPTPGDIARGEATRLTQLGLADRPDLTLEASRVTRIGEEVEIVHLFRQADGGTLTTEPYRDYRPDPAPSSDA